MYVFLHKMIINRKIKRDKKWVCFFTNFFFRLFKYEMVLKTRKCNKQIYVYIILKHFNVADPTSFSTRRTSVHQ